MSESRNRLQEWPDVPMPALDGRDYGAAARRGRPLSRLAAAEQRWAASRLRIERTLRGERS